MASSTAPTGIIRKAVKEDVPEILAMIRELAEYEKDLASCKATEELLIKNLGFSGGPAFAHTVLVCEGEKAVGLALYFYNFSTWTARPGVYLEDLYVRPESRGKGYGTALIAHLAKEVGRIEGGRLDWQVLDWNEPSIKFYKSIGAKHMAEWWTMRVQGDDGLSKLGELGPKLEYVE
ncbi:hypothetical protein TWF694_011808 [Orbilia ellipsospora]|uniref:N-acetyltransferase domain-containing protein n=1 Tax=Orbilia ellipsospora TaxID=2528407 RepID=A0AAV9X7D5_9PEZI